MTYQFYSKYWTTDWSGAVWKLLPTRWLDEKYVWTSLFTRFLPCTSWWFWIDYFYPPSYIHLWSGVFENSSVLTSTSSVYCVSHLWSLFFYCRHFYSQDRRVFLIWQTQIRVFQAGQRFQRSLIQASVQSRVRTAFRPPQSCLSSEKCSKSSKIEETLEIYSHLHKVIAWLMAF